MRKKKAFGTDLMIQRKSTSMMNFLIEMLTSHIPLKKIIGYFFILPAMIAIFALVFYPMTYAGYISLFETNLVTKWDFVGLGNYIRTLAGHGVFWQSMRITGIWTFFVVLGHFVLGMVLALLLNKRIKGRTFFRIIFFLPWVVPTVAAAVIWKWLYNPTFGLLHYLLNSIGLVGRAGLLENTSTALPAVSIVAIWKGFPFVMIMLLAGLQAIPVELYEAAEVDGAGKFHKFWYITLPQLRYVALVAGILDTVWWFKHFTMVYLLTGGGPVYATSIIAVNIYNKAFQDFYFGEAASIAMMVFFVCLTISIIYRKVLEYE